MDLNIIGKKYTPMGAPGKLSGMTTFRIDDKNKKGTQSPCIQSPQVFIPGRTALSDLKHLEQEQVRTVAAETALLGASKRGESDAQSSPSIGLKLNHVRSNKESVDLTY